nr:hypothetical protein [Leptospira noguchii]
MLYGDFVFGIFLLQTILFALFAILTLFQGRLFKSYYIHFSTVKRNFRKQISYVELTLEHIKITPC